MINKDALFSDGTEGFRIPSEPKPYDKVKVRLRVGKGDGDSVTLIVSDGAETPMVKSYGNMFFDYFEGQIELKSNRIRYYFRITKEQQTVYYNAIGPSDYYLREFDFSIMPGFTTPDWAKGAVFYQIFVDRFCNGDASNDVEDREYIYIGEPTTKVRDWSKYPASMGVREFYGGDLQGIMDKLDYLQDLGVDAIYLNPIFVSPSNHKYDIQDYDYVDPHYGRIVKDEGECLPDEGVCDNRQASRYITRVTDKVNLEASNQLFIELVEAIHRRGMKIILDGVFNHCGSFNKWLDREGLYEKQEGYEDGAYVCKDSPYKTYFQFHNENQWPYNCSYDGWWAHDTLPKLNYERSPKLYEDIMRVARKWVSPPFNVDGWRLDVAADLGYSPEYNHRFWREFRKNVKEANPNALILAENYGNSTPWLKGDEWDTTMNYDAFMEPVTWFLTGLEKHSDEFKGEMRGNAQNFFDSMRYHMTEYNVQSLYTAMNELSNHDHSRFLTRTNYQVGRTASRGAEAANDGINKGIMRAAVVIQMTWPGAPTIYYGDEAGVCGWTDPDNRRTYPWGKEDMELIHLHKELIRLHKSYDALMKGSLLFMGGEKDYICYGRFFQDESFVVAVNRGSYERTVDIPVWQLGIGDGVPMVLLITTEEDGYSMATRFLISQDGYLRYHLGPVSAVVIKNANLTSEKK